MLLNTGIYRSCCFPADFNLLLALTTYVPEAKKKNGNDNLNAQKNIQSTQKHLMCKCNYDLSSNMCVIDG